MHKNPTRRSVVAGLAALAASAATSTARSQVRKAQPHARLGINLSGIADWSSEHPFVDMFRASRTWISQRAGAGWGMGPELDMDAYGWVRRLEPGCWADTPLSTLAGGHYPSGKYTVLYDGDGRIDATFGAKAIQSVPGQLQLTVDSSTTPFYIQLKETNPANPVRNIRVIMPGYERTYIDQPLNPGFVKRWAGVSTFRFMDWGLTNNSPVQKWAHRATMQHASWAASGVPMEVMIDVANRTRTNPWICVPHQADDDYIRELGALLKARLDKSLRVYLEYSNEVWNPRFLQGRYAMAQGRLLGLSLNDTEAGRAYYARRSVEMYQLFQSTFGDGGRLVRVLASQAVSAFMSRQILTFADARNNVDALAIAPYMGMSVALNGNGLTAGVVKRWSLDQLFNHLRTNILPEAAAVMVAQRAAAAAFGLPLLAYEGGQHLAGVTGGENVQELTELFVNANGDVRMGALYRDYYRAWDNAGGDVLCHYNSVARWTKWGSWGLLQYEDDAPAKSPKYLATIAWAKGLAQTDLLHP